MKELAKAEQKSQEEAKALADIYKKQDKTVAEHFGVEFKDFQALQNEAKSRLREEFKSQLKQTRLEKEVTEEPVVEKEKQIEKSILKPEELTSDKETLKSLAARRLAAETIKNAPEKIKTGAAEPTIIGDKPITIEQEVIPSQEEGAIKERGEKKYAEEGLPEKKTVDTEAKNLEYLASELADEHNQLEKQYTNAYRDLGPEHDTTKYLKQLWLEVRTKYKKAANKLNQLEPFDNTRNSEEGMHQKFDPVYKPKPPSEIGPIEKAASGLRSRIAHQKYLKERITKHEEAGETEQADILKTTYSDVLKPEYVKEEISGVMSEEGVPEKPIEEDIKDLNKKIEGITKDREIALNYLEDSKKTFGNNSVEYISGLSDFKLIDRELTRLKTIRNNHYPGLSEKATKQQETEPSKLQEISAKRQALIIEGAAKQGLSLKPTNRLFAMFQRLGIVRNVDLQKGTVTTTKIDPITKKEVEVVVKGQAFPREGLKTAIAKIGPEATIDTAPHEIFEIFREDMLTHGSDSQKKLVTKGDRAVEKSSDYLEWKNARKSEGKNSSVREWYAVHTGEDAIRRVLKTDGDGSFKAFLKDFWANVKARYGDGESKDFVRLMSNKLINEAPFHEVFKSDLNVKASRIDEEKLSEEEYPNKESLIEDLQNLTDKLKVAQDASDEAKSKYGPDSKEYKEALKKAISLADKYQNYYDDSSLSYESYKNAEEEGKLPKSKVGIPGIDQVRQYDEQGNIVPEIGKSDPIFNFKSPYENFNRSAYIEFLQKVKGLSKDEANKVAESKITELYEASFNPGDMRKLSEKEGSFPTKFSEDEDTQKLKMVAEKHNINPSTLPVSRTPDDLFIPKFRPEIDKIRHLKTKDATNIADAYTDFYTHINRNRGKYLNKSALELRKLGDLDSLINNIIEHPLDYAKQDTDDFRKVVDWFDSKDKTSIKLSENQIKIRDEVRRTIKQVYTDRNTKKLIPKGPFNPDDLPQTPSRDVINTLQENPDSSASEKLKQQFIDYQTKVENVSDSEAADNLKLFLAGFSKEKINIAEQFGPIDRLDKIGIPLEWREKNLLDRMSRFLERVSRRYAYHDTIENIPGVLDAIKKYRGNESVDFVFNDITGINPRVELGLSSATGLVKSGMLGIVTGTTDFFTNLTLGMQHQQNPIQTIKSAINAWSDIRENLIDSFEKGVNRVNLNTLEWNQGADDYISILRRLRDVISDVQGRNWLEQMTRATAFGQGRFLALDFSAREAKGNSSKQSKKFFKDFGEGIKDKTNLTPDEVKEIAAKYVESVQGTYDSRGLPAIAMEGTLSPYLALARWNIEKANNFMKHVVNPLINGNPYPALMSTIGMFIGGVAVTKIREEYTKRKEKTPKPEEILAAVKQGENVIPAIGYKLIGLASASGYAGALMDLAKVTADVTYGKNKPQWYNNVLIEAVSNSADTVFSLIKSGNELGYEPEMISDVIGKVLEDNFQAARVILAHTSAEKQEEIEKANKFRDLRVYNTIAGNPIRDLSTDWGSKQFGRSDIKEFKRTKDIEKIEELFPQLLEKVIEKANGDPEKLRFELSKLKGNSYQTMPNPKTLPNRFLKYITYLEESQGKEVAVKRLEDYLEQNAINRAKSSRVP